MQNRKPTSSPLRAFTLIELLVVIGIIVTIIAILLPSLSHAKATARQVRCATLLRSWGQAFYTYAGEYNGVLPHSGDRTRNPNSFKNSPYFPENESGYTYVIPPLMGQKSWADYPDGQKPTGGIYQCPDARSQADSEYGYQPSITGYHSFCMNLFLDSGSVPFGTSPYPPFLKLSRAEAPASTILIYETTLIASYAYGQKGTSTISCQDGYYPNDGPGNFGDRHPHQTGKLGGNIVFLDGHLEWRDHLWNDAYANPNNPPLTDRLWWPY